MGGYPDIINAGTIYPLSGRRNHPTKSYQNPLYVNIKESEIINKLGAQTYPRLNGKYLREAQELVAKGDYVQASEKLWGAAAGIVKAVAAKKGIRLGTHKSLGRFVVELDKEHSGWRLQEAFAMAETLHINFYEDNLAEELVKIRAKAVKSMIEKLRTLL